MNELVPAGASVVDRAADEWDLLRRRAEGLAVRWLHGYTTARTRNSYAVDIGLSPELRAALPDGPASPGPAPEWAWIPWALDHGINPAGQLRREHAEAYAHALNGQTKRSRQRRWSALRAFYRHLRISDIVTCDPGEMVNRRTMGLSGADPSPTMPLHTDQVRALYLAAGLPHQSRARSRALLAVLASTGCRAAELVGIDLADYRPQPEGHALVLLDGKGGKRRWVVVPAPDAELVAEYLEVRVGPRPSAVVALPGQVSAGQSGQVPLFTTSKGQRLHVNAVTHTLRTIARRPSLNDQRAEVRKAAKLLAPIVDTIHPHPFRHTYTVVAERNGVPVSQIAQDLGHASIVTTQNYLHAQQGAEHSAARVVSGIYHGPARRAGQLPQKRGW
jgi:integrase/recombinase XerD